MNSNILNKLYSSDPLFQALRDRIVSGEYPPGTILSEKDLTKEFKVSRTPYREALRQLENLKLVRIVPRFGTYVSEIDIPEIMNAYEVRLRLETMAVELATKRRGEKDLSDLKAVIEEIEKWEINNGDPTAAGALDACMHEIVCKASGNSVLMETVCSLRLICGRIWTSRWRKNYDFQKLISDWIIIYESIESSDTQRASEAMADHIQDSMNALKKSIFGHEDLSNGGGDL